MKKILALAGFLFSVSVLFSQMVNKSFTVKGDFSGFPDSTVVMLQDVSNNAVYAKGMIISGKIDLTGQVNEPILCWISIPGEAKHYLYLENNDIYVSGDKPLTNGLSISGSSSHYDFVLFQSIFDPLFLKLQTTVNSLNITPEGELRDSIYKEYQKTVDTIQQKLDYYVEHFNKSSVTPFILLATSNVYDDPLLLEKRFLKLDPSVKVSRIGKSLEDFIAYHKVGAVGTAALDISQPDTSGNTVALSSFRGKYVLVDFWASWCRPCRMENPNVVANYNKFKDKNFTVLGVSLDQPGKKDNWVKAIHQDNLTWTHISDLQYWNNAAAKLYHVTGIPFNFLVDPNGMIVARNLRGAELQSKLCELLGCN